MELDIRKQKILKAIIEEYTKTGIPVGSKTISNIIDINVSPATVRNDMAVLFDMGMLEQPYTSAGRVPSHLGYRYYLDNLLDFTPLSNIEQSAIQAMFNVANPDPDKLLSDAMQMLAEVTNCATIVSAITPCGVCVRRIELIPASENVVIIMIIATNGVVKSKACKVMFTANKYICEFFTNFANSHFAGCSLNEISSSYINSVSFDLGDYYTAFNSVLSSIYELCKEINDGQFLIKGQTNLLHYQELEDSAGELLIWLDNKEHVLNIIPEEPFDFKVIVGKENNKMELAESSIILSKYSICGTKCGAIGIIGPVRMQYEKLIPKILYFSNMLGELLSDTFSVD